MNFILVFMFAITVGTTVAQSEGGNRCEPITVDVCRGYTTGKYNHTIFPNPHGGKSQRQAERKLNTFLPLIEAQCSPFMLPFLCAAYVPVCTVIGPIPPCRSACQQAKEGCESLLISFGMEWPNNLKCRDFPTAGSRKVCVPINEEDLDKPSAPTTIPNIPEQAASTVSMQESLTNLPTEDTNSETVKQTCNCQWSSTARESSFYPISITSANKDGRAEALLNANSRCSFQRGIS
ncbi:frizzled-7-B-like [Glandiceps talaboti]